jgi:cytoskeletal protein CcmA (bactofilin family)
MFNKKKTFHAARIDTLVGQGTEIKGNLVFSGGLHIDGNVIGNVIAEEGSSSILILSEFGRIEGEVKAPNMVLNGEVVGDRVGAEIENKR